jgi:hypothetical protein
MAEQNPLPKWLKPLPVRVGVSVLPLLWSAFEFYGGQTIWGVIFIAIACWGFYTLVWKPPPGT